TSPNLSRNHSYADQYPPSPAATQRPALPRSVSSTSYLNKQRRSPSLNTATNTAANGVTRSTDKHTEHAPSAHGGAPPPPPDTHTEHAPSANGSLRQSPPPVNNLLIPTGAISTPPDSSDDEERGRSIGNLKELQKALQHIPPLNRQAGSPTRDGTDATPAKPAASGTQARPLSAGARKISHSRSSSDLMLSKHAVSPLNTEQPFTSSSDGSDLEDDEIRRKPLLVRKKSGELVKPALRPAAHRRPSSMPGTPTYHKAVHFNENMEQVRHFLTLDKPIAVSASTSPVETYDSDGEYPFFSSKQQKEPEWDIKLTNFPKAETYERTIMPVRVERIFLASDHKTLVGTIACANISFHKVVIARFTLDYWKTTSEVVAEYNNDIRRKQKDDGYDRFNFNIKLADQANLESKTLLLCARYQCNGQEFWDNNNSINYQVDFVKKSQPQQKAKGGSGKPRAIPRSRHAPPAPRPKSMPVGAFDDDFGMGFEFGAGRAVLSQSPSSSIKLKPKNKRGSLFPDQAPPAQGTSQAFSTRYDFGASLSAALSTAQNALGDRSGINANGTPKANKGYFDKTSSASVPALAPAFAPVSAAPIPGTRPDTMSSGKPGLQSAEYHELIQKFCFYGTPSKASSPKAITPAAKNSDMDGATEYVVNSSSGSNQSSASNSPPSPVMPVQVDGASDSRSSSRSPFLPRSTSPGPVTGPEICISSPYQYGYNMPGGIFPEQNHAPQACV
ncbi:hypothetical protein P280DRAFT_359680, partial [Massarina eburnea CBS 473.64]